MITPNMYMPLLFRGNFLWHGNGFFEALTLEFTYLILVVVPILYALYSKSAYFSNLAVTLLEKWIIQSSTLPIFYMESGPQLCMLFTWKMDLSIPNLIQPCQSFTSEVLYLINV